MRYNVYDTTNNYNVLILSIETDIAFKEGEGITLLKKDVVYQIECINYNIDEETKQITYTDVYCSR